MTKSIGISAAFRKDQLVGGAFFVFENLSAGFSELLHDTNLAKDLSITVFHTQAVADQQDSRLQWRQVSDRLGRFIAEANVGIQSHNIDGLLYLNYFTPPVVRAARTVTIIHDLQYLHMPELYSVGKKAWLRICHAITLRKCNRVVTISNVVKEDILRAYGDRWGDKVEVIWNPISVDRLQDTTCPDYTNGRPYLLCVAVDRPQKNLFRLIKAFNEVRVKFPDYCLVLAGQLRTLRKSSREQSEEVGRGMPSTVELVADLGIEDHVRITGFVSDQQLGALYRGATMCILPSLFEGFGMPAVESLAMGKPTLVSGLPVLREVTLNSAHYLDDPKNVDAMADSIMAILRYPVRYEPNNELIQKVRASFAPRTIAEKYLQVLTS